MNYDRPVCGHTHVHPAHEWGGSLNCRGWTTRQAETARLIDRLNQLARVLREDRLPVDGAKLECHPSVINSLRQMVLPDFASGSLHDDPVKPVIPIMASTSKMRPGEWRIVLDDGIV